MDKEDLQHSIIAQLTEDQKDCILNLTRDWKTEGFSVLHAALLWATDSRLFPERFPQLVESRLIRGLQTSIGVTHHYRLTSLGLDIQEKLRRERINAGT